MKPFTSEHYHRAALERMQQAVTLYRQGQSYALAMYIAGVAVECILRAFKLRRDPTFDEKHHLLRLFHASGIMRLDAQLLRKSSFSEEELKSYLHNLHSVINDVYRLWSNDYRFASEDRLRTYLRKNLDRRRQVKGDLAKAFAFRLVNAAQKFVTKGQLLWEIS